MHFLRVSRGESSGLRLTIEPKIANFLVVLLVLVATSCQIAKPVSQRSGSQEGKFLESGVASWYGPGFQGKKTANGETFDTRALTAAHRTLPFGTKVLVRNMTNGKEVIVRINDRGPYAKKRIIDLSKAAAEKIAMVGAGTASVRLYLLDSDPDQLDIDNIKQPGYTVQVAAYEERQGADRKAKSVPEGWVKKVKVNQKTVYRVYAGRFKTTAEASAFKTKLQKQGVAGFVKQIENRRWEVIFRILYREI